MDAELFAMGTVIDILSVLAVIALVAFLFKALSGDKSHQGGWDGTEPAD